MLHLLKERFESGKYDRLSHPRQFAEKLTGDIYSVLKDRHVRVRLCCQPKNAAAEKSAVVISAAHVPDPENSAGIGKLT